MKVSVKFWRSSIVVVMVGIALIMSMSSVVFAAANPNPGVLPPKSHPYGLTYGEWNARWWQWAFSIPASVNPLLDPTGANCGEGQSGPVWFLAGTFSAGSTSRSCTIPAGKALLVPIINSWADNVCNNGIDKNLPPQTVDQLRAIATSFVSPVTNLHASIDGSPLTNLESYQAISPVFSYTVPSSSDNVITASFTDNNGNPISFLGPCWPSLTVTPAVADGFYIMLHPLTPGSHSINFGGSGPGITLNVTYNLTVK